MILERLQKSSFVGFKQLSFGIYDAVANFNIRAKAAVLIYEDLKIEPDYYYTLYGCVKANMKQIKTLLYTVKKTLFVFVMLGV